MMDTIFWSMVKMILALGGVGAVLLFLLRQLKRKDSVRKGLPSNSGIRVLATQPIAPQKYISLVEIGGEVLALGVSEAQITLLSKVENRDFVEKMTNQGTGRLEPFSLLHCLQGLPLRSKGPKPGFLRRIYER
jgi:flagellar biogenesis protein FliO